MGAVQKSLFLFCKKYIMNLSIIKINFMFKKIVGLGFSSKWKNAKDVEKYIKNLVDSWAWEFFVGYNPNYWSEKFGFEVSPNGRFAEHEQVTDFETLKDIVFEAHKYDIEIFANLNAWYYTSETMPYIERMVNEFIEIWIDWIICWNIEILEYLKSIDYQWKINISTIMSVYNNQAIRFFIENYNINKFILSREITLKEIKSLTKEFPEMKFEVFGEWDFCRYNNWLCFAEHKYWDKDICTVVVNDLIIKKRFKPDFKEIILDTNLSNKEKIEKLNDKYISDFDKINEILWKIELWFLTKEDLVNDLLKIIIKNKNNPDLYFDSLISLENKHNKNVLIYLRAIKILLKNSDLDKINKDILLDVEQELNNSFKTYIEYNKKKIEEIWWESKLKALQLASFYSRSDNLNLYSYLFFNKIKNIDTVKFPTRWRNYSEKIKIIDEVLKQWKIDKDLLDRSISLDRTHYDLTYLFWDKLWFRKMLIDNKK